MAINWKVLSMAASVVGGAVSIAAGIIDDKKRTEEIREEVRNEFDRRNGGES